MQHTYHASSQSLVQRPCALIPLYLEQRLEYVSRVFSVVIRLLYAAKSLGLHARPNHPEGICQNVAANACGTSRQRVKVEAALLPSEIVLS